MFYNDSLYFQRRQGLIVQKGALGDVTDSVITLRRTKGTIFTEGAIAHVIEKLGLNYETIIRRVEENTNAA
ncbi:hypothetical protein EL84_25915 [Paenibacillus sp. VT-400]|nr:hypothetical protein EL84_25915 [Paenibacillus sp. VT-400]